MENVQMDMAKIKTVLVAIWKEQPTPETYEIIDEFSEELDNIKQGN
jgi:hypothetical protein